MRIDPATGAVRDDRVADMGVEFPRANDRLEARATRYVHLPTRGPAAIGATVTGQRDDLCADPGVHGPGAGEVDARRADARKTGTEDDVADDGGVQDIRFQQSFCCFSTVQRSPHGVGAGS